MLVAQLARLDMQGLLQVDEVVTEDLEETPMEQEDLLRRPFQEFLVKTTPSLQRFQRHRLPVTVRLMEGITQTQRGSASLSTSAPAMEMEDSQSTPSSAPTEPSSTSSTLSATGGSTSIAPPQKTFIS